MQCIYCKKEVEVVQGHVVTHPHQGLPCEGSGFTPSKMSRDADFLEMMRQLKGVKKKSE